jgi:hypothetical protein
VGLVYVEVSGKECREVLSEFFHFFLYQQGTFYPGLFADMVHVQVEEQELTSGIFMPEVPP